MLLDKLQRYWAAASDGGVGVFKNNTKSIQKLWQEAERESLWMKPWLFAFPGAPQRRSMRRWQSARRTRRPVWAVRLHRRPIARGWWQKAKLLLAFPSTCEACWEKLSLADRFFSYNRCFHIKTKSHRTDGDAGAAGERRDVPRKNSQQKPSWLLCFPFWLPAAPPTPNINTNTCRGTDCSDRLGFTLQELQPPSVEAESAAELSEGLPKLFFGHWLLFSPTLSSPCASVLTYEPCKH